MLALEGDEYLPMLLIGRVDEQCVRAFAYIAGHVWPALAAVDIDHILAEKD